MDIVKITMSGYGCDIARGTMSIKEHKKMKHLIDNVWHKNLYKKLKKESNIKTHSKNCGVIKGEIQVEVNDYTVLDTDLTTLEVLGNIESIKEEYPKTNDVVITTVQHQEGTFCDVIFILNGVFDVSKLKLIRKDVMYNVDNPLVSSLYCEMYYDGIQVPLEVSETDLRNSRLYLETLKKHGKNKNR
jgi:hypothetical protein